MKTAVRATTLTSLSLIVLPLISHVLSMMELLSSQITPCLLSLARTVLVTCEMMQPLTTTGTWTLTVTDTAQQDSGVLQQWVLYLCYDAPVTTGMIVSCSALT